MGAGHGHRSFRGGRVGYWGIAMASLLGVAGCLPQTPRGTETAAYETSRQAFTTGPGIPNAVKPSGTTLGANIVTSVTPSNSANPKVMSPGKHFLFSSIVNKALFIGGNASHEIWNISNPTSPVRMTNPSGTCPTSATAPTPGSCELVSPFRGGEAESHQHSFSLFPDGSIHAVTISGQGHRHLGHLQPGRAPLGELHRDQRRELR